MRILVSMLLLAHAVVLCGAEDSGPRFRLLVLSEEFFSEGATFADIDADGNPDVVSGPFWYAGPDFQVRTAYMPSRPCAISGYSDHFFSFTADLDSDGDQDILVVPIPGRPVHWFSNPGQRDGAWAQHLILEGLGGESPLWADLTGDGRPELIGIHDGAFGYASPGEDPTAPWRFLPVTPQAGYGQFTHGMGIGDINGDGRLDLLEKNGWWEQTARPGELFRPHAFPFAQSGGAQMYAYDFDGDGDNDVVSVQNAHGWGLKWFEQRGTGSDISFIPHEIFPDRFDVLAETLNISQMHALALADIDGDGIQDLVTGKRFYAHGGRDPGAHQLPVLAWCRTVRTPAGVRFEPRVIGERTGVGTQLTVRDITGNGRPDLVVGNKLGTSLLLNRVGKTEERTSLPKLKRQIGTDVFAKVVRQTEPLTPEEERRSFSLPPGFEVQLFAAEPEIDKPMNMAFDDRGRLWVSSSREYPLPAPPGRKPRDTIRILEDSDGDGRADRVTTFADGLNIPMGLYPYRDGVICFSIPGIWFLRDTDGDGKVDQREQLYGPFDVSKDTHGMCNAFRRGPDGWIYACHGFNNRSVVAGSDGHQIEMHSGNTFRFRPDGSRIEHYSRGMVNPFGSVFDPYGDFFVADCHSRPISLILQNGYYDSFGKPHDGLGYVPDMMNHSHGSTAIGGLARYSADVFPPEYHGSMFCGNVMTSRINHNSLQYTGSSVRAREEPDFLISGDPWFRPVDFQTGPDGALYVADFYNRIIGHYEVDLDHPDRDRRRGRIWRIHYTGERDRRIRPRTGRRRVLPQARAAELWASFRRRELKDGDLTLAMSDPDALVRTHAFRILNEMSQPFPAATDWLQRGFSDAAPIVRRVAAMAAGKHAARAVIRPLLDLFHRTPAGDVHLRHVIRMSLRDQLRHPGVFQAVMRTVRPQDVSLISGICLALKTPEAGEFLARSIPLEINQDPQKLVEYMQFAVRYATSESIAGLTATARSQFKEDLDLQRELLDAAREGMEQRGEQVPPSVRSWALDLATVLLGQSQQVQPFSWTYTPHPGLEDSGSPFVMSTRRRSQDGMQKTPLISSFPLGEQRTGVYRSASFRISRTFQFYMAGHDGLPGKPHGNKNFVSLRDEKSHEILQTWLPPRNDTAQPYEWQATGDTDSQRRVYVEITDGDSAGAFAWLAVGRFSDPRLNPSGLAEDRRRAAQLAGDFQLSELRTPLASVLRRVQTDRGMATALADAIVRLNPDSRLAALALVPEIGGTAAEMQSKSLSAIIENRPGSARELLQLAMQSATAAEQIRLADRLAADLEGALTLVSLVESGAAAARLLNRPGLRDRLDALAADDVQLTRRIEKLIGELPDENEELRQRVTAATVQYRQSSGSPAAGLAVFQKRCAACHQVAGKGARVGPNLDGIGNRGLDRIVEDLLMPNRNVDVAFRATTVVTRAGQVFHGLVKRTAGARLILVDGMGKEISIPVDSIDTQVKSTRSPMPENLGDMFTDREFRDLLAWLLSLRSG